MSKLCNRWSYELCLELLNRKLNTHRMNISTIPHGIPTDLPLKTLEQEASYEIIVPTNISNYTCLLQAQRDVGNLDRESNVDQSSLNHEYDYTHDTLSGFQQGRRKWKDPERLACHNNAVLSVSASIHNTGDRNETKLSIGTSIPGDTKGEPEESDANKTRLRCDVAYSSSEDLSHEYFMKSEWQWRHSSWNATN